MTSPHNAAPAARQSLRWRLPLFISVLFAVVLAGFLWAAYGTVKSTLVRTGGERARAAAEQVASLVDGQAAVEQLRKVAADDALRTYLQAPSPAGREAALKRLTTLVPGGPRRVEVWDTAGSRVLELYVPGRSRGPVPSLPPGSRPTAPGIGPLQNVNGTVVSEIVAEIHASSPPAQPVRIGHLVFRSVFSMSRPGMIFGLVGRDAVVMIGNVGDPVWTDLSRAVTGPAVDTRRTGVVEYGSANGEMHVGALSPIRGTPWAAWVELPRGAIIAPAQVFLNRMILIGLICMAIGAALASVLAGRLTRPLAELTTVAEAIAAGDYSQRGTVREHDEIGRLAEAFNVMAGHVESAQHHLEALVVERTAELSAARREAERANDAKSAFLSRMSHDLRTPLNSVIGFAQLFETDKLLPEQRENVQQILNGSRHLLQLIDEVLQITKAETGQVTLSTEPIGVADVVTGAVALIRPLADRRGLRVSVDVAPEDWVMADRQRLSDVLLNLLSNAVKYNRPGGAIKVRVEHHADRVRLGVTDTGAGIPPEKLPRLFTPFDRLGAELGPEEGTGLGLALARTLAMAMRGSIHVDSQTDVGTTFWLDLPRAEPVAVTLPDSASALLEFPGEVSGLVLYIDDTPSNLLLARRVLERREDVKVLTADCGEEGIRLAREFHPSLILLDLHLPDIDGKVVLQRLREDEATRRIPVVIVSADATPATAERVVADGAAGYMSKPLDIHRLLRVVDEYCQVA